MNRPALFLFVSVIAGTLAQAADTWVAVGYGGRRMISNDGVKWEITAEWASNGGDDSNNLMSLAYGHQKIVAVGGGGFARDQQAGHVLVSKDGREWREVYTDKFRINPVVFGDGRFVAGGPDRALVWSDDGEQWKRGGRVDDDGFPAWAMWFRHGAFGNSKFVMMGECGAKKEYYWALATGDGSELSFRRDLPPLRGLAFGAGLFVGVGHGVIVVSEDGKDWRQQARAADEKLEWIHWTGQNFVTGGAKKSLISKDGQTWEDCTLRAPGKPLWTDGTRWITASWPGKMSFSADGSRWASSPVLPPNGINKVLRIPD